MKSIGNQIAQLAALIGARDVTAWEDQFLTDMRDLTNGGKVTSALSGRQVEVIERLYRRHFADAEA